MKEIPTPNAEFYPIWNCPHCTIVVPREPGAGKTAECENCLEVADAWIMTPDFERKEEV